MRRPARFYHTIEWGDSMDRKVPTWWDWIVWGLILAFLIIGFILSLTADAHADHDHHDTRCFVEYAPDRWQDFSDLWQINHRDGSKIVNYLMDTSGVVRHRYESAYQARRWIRRVYRQLRECN